MTGYAPDRGAPEPLAVARHWLSIGHPERAIEEVAKLGAGRTYEGAVILIAAKVGLGDGYGAAQLAGDALADRPRDVYLLHLLGLARAELADDAGAERAFLAALAEQPDNPDVLTEYGRLVARAGQVAKARRLLERAAVLAPDDPDVLAAMVELAYIEGDDRRARELSAELMRIAPGAPQSSVMHGFTGFVTGDVSGARRHFGAAAATQPDPDIADMARTAAQFAHWSMWPLRPLLRFGVVPVWMAGVALLLVSTALPAPVGAAVVLAWLLYNVYSWIAPPIVLRLLRRRQP